MQGGKSIGKMHRLLCCFYAILLWEDAEKNRPETGREEGREGQALQATTSSTPVQPCWMGFQDTRRTSADSAMGT